MMPIKKGKAPQELADAVRRIKSTPNITLSWSEIDRTERQATLNSLLREQGGLCAYCTRKITETNAHVEHIKPQSEGRGADDQDSVDYRNLLAVCDGFEGNPAGLTCDRSRGDTPLTVNPLKEGTLESIRYRGDGAIYSKRPEVEYDLNITLNLNQKILVRNRHAALKEANKWLEQRGKRRGNTSVRAFCEHYIDSHLSDPTQRQPYDGIVLYAMGRRVRAAG